MKDLHSSSNLKNDIEIISRRYTALNEKYEEESSMMTAELKAQALLIRRLSLENEKMRSILESLNAKKTLEVSLDG